jgi:hypothetical protein
MNYIMISYALDGLLVYTYPLAESPMSPIRFWSDMVARSS